MPIKQTGKMTGFKNWEKGLKEIKDHMYRGRRFAIIKWCLLIKKRSMMKCPVRQGNLRASAFIVLDDGELGIAEAFTGPDAGQMGKDHATVVNKEKAATAAITNDRQIVGAVGHSARYAAIVHELPSAGAAGYDAGLDVKISRGQRKGKRRRAEEVHSTVGQWKFLETAINESNAQGLRILQKELKFV